MEKQKKYNANMIQDNKMRSRKTRVLEAPEQRKRDDLGIEWRENERQRERDLMLGNVAVRVGSRWKEFPINIDGRSLSLTQN